MKWFFLAFVILMGALINLAVMTNDPFSKVPAIAAFNLALVGLLLIWYGAYFEADVINAKGKDLGTALLIVAVGAFILQGGINAALSNSCDGFLSSRSLRLGTDIVRFLQSHGYCAEIGYVVGLAGICLAYLGAKLFFRVNRGTC